MHKIYIPTFKRVDEQITLNSIPGEYKDDVILVVQEQELSEHKKARPEFNEDNYLVVGNDIGIAETRRQIIYHAGETRFFIFDDDVVFHRRNMKFLMRENYQWGLFYSDMKDYKLPDNRTSRKMADKDFGEMIEIFDTWMNDGIIQIGYRSANLPPSWHLYTDFTDVYTGYMINGAEVSKFRDEIDWTFVKVGEDSMMTLEFLLRGYKIRRSELFCIQPKWWQEGGCEAMGRNAELHDKEHRKLLEKYGKEGDAHSIVYKKYNIERPRIGWIEDYRFRWKEAYRSYYVKKIGECNTLEEALPYFKHIG